MRVVTGWLAAALVLLSSGYPARAATFEAWLVYEGVDEFGVRYQASLSLEPWLRVNEAGNGVIENWSWSCYEPECADGGFQVLDLDLTLDPDPTITFGQAVLDIGAPSNFGFVFQQAIVPTTTPGFATASLAGSTTNGGGVAGVVTVTPTSPPVFPFIPQDNDGIEPNEIMVYTLSTNGGATWLNAGLDLGPAFSSNPTLVSDSYGNYNEGPIAGPAGSGSYDRMRVDVNFQLSGGGDRFTFNGNATIIPEPTTVSLMALGLLGLAWTGRRRRL